MKLLSDEALVRETINTLDPIKKGDHVLVHFEDGRVERAVVTKAEAGDFISVTLSVPHKSSVYWSCHPAVLERVIESEHGQENRNTRS